MEKRLSTLTLLVMLAGCAGAHSERIGSNRYNIKGEDDLRSFFGNAEENFIAEAK